MQRRAGRRWVAGFGVVAFLLSMALPASAFRTPAGGTALIPGALVLAAALGQPAGACDKGTRLIEGYRVLVDPTAQDLSTREALERLRGEGIDDAFVVSGGDYAGQVGVGFFRSRSNATARVAALEALGFSAVASEYRARVPSTTCTEADATADSAPPPARPQRDSEPPTATRTATPPSSDIATDTESAPGETAPPPRSAEPAPTIYTTSSDRAECANRGDSFIVLADPADNGSDVLVLVYKLRAAGVSNLFVVTAEPNKGQVAIGLYDDAREAQARVDELSDLGFQVRSEARSTNGSDCE
jgi:hypothetical protein